MSNETLLDKPTLCKRWRVSPRTLDRLRSAGLLRWLDLAAANRRTLRGLGVPAEQIWESGLCTACEPGLLFSYRRDGVTGRMGAMIGLA